MSWHVIEAKWEGTRRAFAGFDPERVAAMTPADVDRLVGDARVIRNRRKIEAIVGNAGRMIELDREHQGFRRYLESCGSFDASVAALRREFRFLGESGSLPLERRRAGALARAMGGGTGKRSQAEASWRDGRHPGNKHHGRPGGRMAKPRSPYGRVYTMATK
jgi:hypothetical protein